MKYLIITSDGVDQICDGQQEALVELEDLDKMGHDVAGIKCPNDMADELEDLFNKMAQDQDWPEKFWGHLLTCNGTVSVPSNIPNEVLTAITGDMFIDVDESRGQTKH